MNFSIKLFFTVNFLFSAFILNAQRSLADSLFHPDSLRHIVEELSADSMKGRFSGTIENLKAAHFIKTEFEKTGLKPIAGNNGFYMEIKPGLYNVVAAMQGRSKPGQVVIFSAHYDHVGTSSTNPYPEINSSSRPLKANDTIFNGANDNASGVCAVISLARYFRALNNNERTLIFVAFTGEELGLLGSQALADAFQPDSIVAMINIEMIGRNETNRSRPYITGDEYSDIRKILNMNYRTYADKPEKEYFKYDPYFQSSLFSRSDNYSFAAKGVPAHSIMLTPPNDKFYHHPSDEAGTLNYDFMKNIIKGIAYGATGIVKGTDTPMRIKKIR